MPSLNRIEHNPQGDPCRACQWPAANHRVRKPRPDYWRQREHTRTPRPKRQDRIIGIDGEGEGRQPHRYTYLSSSDERGQSKSIANHEDRLSTIQCLDFLVTLPDRGLIVGFAILYDLTKILEDVDNERLWYLFHEESRAIKRDGRIIYRGIRWPDPRRGPYVLNYMNRRFSVAKIVGWREKLTKMGPKQYPIWKRITVWDVFTFYQTKFTAALRTWKVGDVEEIEWIESMKDKRSNLVNEDKSEIQRYCNLECHRLAQLVRALITAHDNAGLHLTSFFGAGSTASALLKRLSVKDKRGTLLPEMRDAVSRSFFGGRFENSWVGPLAGPIYGKDINGAYPYRATFLPCLAHGRWEHVNTPSPAQLQSATAALIHWHVPIAAARKTFSTKSRAASMPAWGPWPVRSKLGTIAFPLGGRGGWVWRDEFVAGLKMQPNAIATESWLYHEECDCKPFSTLPDYYKERIKLGKDREGIVLKLGVNAGSYGKFAQSRGLDPPYQCWIWASMITSGTRAQLLDAILAARNPWDVIMLATDGVFSREPLDLPEPLDTGTSDCISEGKNKKLGGWTDTTYEQGMFCVRPGIYFPLHPTEEDIKEVKARGIGKKSLLERWNLVVKAWIRKETKIKLGGMARFVGVKSAITKTEDGKFHRSPNYGEWIEHEIDVSFNPAPKRDGYITKQRLKPWDYMDWESEPYKPADKDPEVMAMLLAKMIEEEQPNADFLDVDFGT